MRSGSILTGLQKRMPELVSGARSPAVLLLTVPSRAAPRRGQGQEGGGASGRRSCGSVRRHARGGPLPCLPPLPHHPQAPESRPGWDPVCGLCSVASAACGPGTPPRPEPRMGQGRSPSGPGCCPSREASFLSETCFSSFPLRCLIIITTDKRLGRQNRGKSHLLQ